MKAFLHLRKNIVLSQTLKNNCFKRYQTTNEVNNVETQEIKTSEKGA